jgi:hypothetical protein
MVVGSSFQLIRVFLFCIFDLSSTFHLYKSAYALSLSYKILVVYFVKFLSHCSLFHISSEI